MAIYDIKINGKSLNDKLLSVRWSHGINRIPELKIRLFNLESKASNYLMRAYDIQGLKEPKIIDSRNAFSMKAEVAVGKEKGSSEFKGIVTGVRVCSDEGGCLELTVHSSAISLTEGEETKFLKAVKGDKEAIVEIAKLRSVKISYNGIDKNNYDFKENHKNTFIYNETPWRAIQNRAISNGWLLVPSQEKDELTIIKSEYKKSSLKGFDLPSESVSDFSFWQDSTSEISTINLSSNTLGKPDTIVNKKGLQQIYPNPKGYFTRKDDKDFTQNAVFEILDDEKELVTKANAMAFFRYLDKYQGIMTVLVDANPEALKIKLGERLTVTGIGTELEGRHFVSAIHHELTSEHWQMTIEFGLHLNYTLFSDWAKPPPMPHLCGIVTAGEVKNNLIPVKIPQVENKDDAVLYARLAMPYASKGAGFCMPPQKGDEVLLNFINGDVRNPVILGSMYNEANKPFKEFKNVDATHMGIYWGDKKPAIDVALEKDKEELKLIAGEKNTVAVNEKEGTEIASDKNKITVGKKLILNHDNKPVFTMDEQKELKIETDKFTVKVGSMEVVKK